ncbi:MAG: DUF3310 domain-containing protein [Pseudomonadota bacterium]
MKADDNQVGGDHYKKLDIQPWTAMEAWMPREQFIGFLRGNAIKYLARAGHKDSLLEAVKKARHYLDKLVEIEEAAVAPPSQQDLPLNYGGVPAVDGDLDLPAFLRKTYPKAADLNVPPAAMYATVAENLVNGVPFEITVPGQYRRRNRQIVTLRKLPSGRWATGEGVREFHYADNSGRVWNDEPDALDIVERIS